MTNYHFGTWNIGTLKVGQVRFEVLCSRKVKVCCIQEVRWKGEGSKALQGYKFIWKGNSEGTAGVGVLVASELADRIIRVERINDRVIAVDLVIGEQIVKVVSCYAPQSGRSQIEKEEFWRQVEEVIMNTGINQEITIGGDMNDHVGQVANGFHEVHGNFGYGSRNAGERILEFAETMGYVVTNTLFKKRQSHLVTYESGGNKTAVDMILIKRQHKKRIMNTKVIPGKECVHGLYLVVMDMHLKVRKYRKNHQGLHKVQPRIKVWKQKKQEVRKAYLEKLQERDIDTEDSVRVEE